MTALVLRLGHPLASLRASLTNGPGWRIGLWVQGCRLRCTDRCLSPHLLDPAAGLALPSAEVAAAVVATAQAAPVSVEGITVLGGEPTEQAEALVPVLAAARAAHLSTMVYSGHPLEALEGAGPAVAALLALTDLLVDGPYLPDQADGRLPWRGSANQRLLPLTARYDAPSLDRAFAHQQKAFSIQVRADGSVSVSGLQERPAAARIERLVRPSRRS